MKDKIIMGNVLEGESYVGKTTSIEAIKGMEKLYEKGIIVVPEYSVIGKLPDFPRASIEDLKKSIQKIIDLEKRRTDKLSKDLSKNKEAHILFDRGPVSCIAFEHAAEKAGYIGAALWLAEAFQREIEDKNIIIPRGMIHLKASEEVIKEREGDDIKKGRGKIMDFLKDKDVIKSLNEAFGAFGEYLPKQLFLTLQTDNKKPEEVGAEVLQFIIKQPLDVTEKTPDFLKYAESLMQRKNG